MTDLVITTKLTKDGGHNWGAARMRSLGTTGKFKGRLIRRRIGIITRMGLEASNASPFKAPVIAVALLVTPEG